MKEEIIKVPIPSEWDLTDSLRLKKYYQTIESLYEDYEILGFIKEGDEQTCILKKY